MPVITRIDANLKEMGVLIEVLVGIDSGTKRLYQQDQVSVPQPISAMAMIDSGASHSGISVELAKKLKLIPIGKTVVGDANGGEVPRSVHRIGIHLPEMEKSIDMPVSELGMDRAELLLGRDFLVHFQLIYDGTSDKFSLFSFR